MLRLFVFLLYSCLALICSSSMAAPLMADELRRELSGAEVDYLRDPEGHLAIQIHDVSSSNLADNFSPSHRGGAYPP